MDENEFFEEWLLQLKEIFEKFPEPIALVRKKGNYDNAMRKIFAIVKLFKESDEDCEYEIAPSDYPPYDSLDLYLKTRLFSTTEMKALSEALKGSYSIDIEPSDINGVINVTIAFDDVFCPAFTIAEREKSNLLLKHSDKDEM